MDARVALLHLWTALVLLTAEWKWIDTSEVYTNTWAVQIDGGPEEADRIAREHGFINHGNVSSTYSMPYFPNTWACKHIGGVSHTCGWESLGFYRCGYRYWCLTALIRTRIDTTLHDMAQKIKTWDEMVWKYSTVILLLCFKGMIGQIYVYGMVKGHQTSLSLKTYFYKDNKYYLDMTRSIVRFLVWLISIRARRLHRAHNSSCSNLFATASHLYSVVFVSISWGCWMYPLLHATTILQILHLAAFSLKLVKQVTVWPWQPWLQCTECTMSNVTAWCRQLRPNLEMVANVKMPVKGALWNFSAVLKSGHQFMLLDSIS